MRAMAGIDDGGRFLRPPQTGYEHPPDRYVREPPGRIARLQQAGRRQGDRQTGIGVAQAAPVVFGFAVAKEDQAHAGKTFRRPEKARPSRPKAAPPRG